MQTRSTRTACLAGRAAEHPIPDTNLTTVEMIAMSSQVSGGPRE
jgi:hypothetical protein